MKKIILLAFLLLFAVSTVFPRFYKLDIIPPGLHIDEVSFAADAKAIAETGRDTWNNSWPSVFKAFGEWKAPGLVYSMAFWTKLLGRMDSSVARLPSAISGVVILVALALTLRELKFKNPLKIIIFTVFVVAYSPWHFDMSRVFYEAFNATSFIAISLWLITKATISESKNTKILAWSIVFAGLAGYWYASIRYVVISSMIIIVLLQDWSLNFKLKKLLLFSVILLGIGIGWVGDIVSPRGLNRLHYYSSTSSQGAALAIDEKRQYCYLSHNKVKDKAEYCYLIWNKPVYKIISAAKTYYTYLGTDFLFLKATSDFGFDSEYGAYLLPLLPLYLVGLFSLLKGTVIYLQSIFTKNVKISNIDRLYTIYITIALISLLPAAVASNINMRMGLVALYITAIAIGIGASEIYNWLKQYFQKFSIFVTSFYLVILAYFIIQSMLHYYLVFTHSNDMMWTSDASGVFSYVKSVSKDYDRIIDSELHGPLAPYFYGDISTQDVQQGDHSQPDQFGFTYLTKAGKYEQRHVNVSDLACEKYGQENLEKMLVITSPNSRLSAIAKYSGKSWSGALTLREVYDVDDIVAYELKNNSSFASTCMSK